MPATDQHIPLILVVDDEPIIAATAVEILRLRGYRAIGAHNGRIALDLAARTTPDLLLSDIVMPEMNGFELAREIRERFPACKILLFSGNAATSQELASRGTPDQDFEVVGKPLHPAELLSLIEKALKA